MESHQLINATSGEVEYYTPIEIIEAARATMGRIELDPFSSAKANEVVKASRFWTEQDDAFKQKWESPALWMNHPFRKSEKACKPGCVTDCPACGATGKAPADTQSVVQLLCAQCEGFGKLYKKQACRKRGHCVAQDVPGNADCVHRLIEAYAAGAVAQACMITFAATSEEWFRPLLKYPQCFLHGRTNYRKADGSILKGVTKGSVVTFLPPRDDSEPGEFMYYFSREFARLGTAKIAY